MKKLCAFVIMILCMFSFVHVRAASGEAYYIATNPGADLATSVIVSWHSDISDSFVEYTLASDTTYSQKAIVVGTCREFSKLANEDGYLSQGFASRYVCYAEINGLTPNTKYMYHVGKTTFSGNYYFNTAVNSSSFSFLHITDPQYGSYAQATIFNGLMGQAYGINPDIGFTFFTGDIVDRGGKEPYWEYFYQQPNVSKTIVSTVPGNHEYYDASASPQTWDASYYNAFFRNPQNGPEANMNSSYYFRYNNALFVMIDSESKNQTANTTWFTGVLEANLDADFVIVGMHRSFYGSIYASDSVTIRSLWQKIFDRYGVDLVLSGHDHIYARSYSVYNDQISTDPIRGTTYIIGGYGGPKNYSAIANEKYAKVIEFNACANIITVDQDKISIQLINTAGATIDTAVINRKRIGSANASFTKEAFLETVEVTPDSKNSATVTWSDMGFKNVANVQVVNKKYGFVIADTHLYHQSFTSLAFTGIMQNVLNEFIIRVKFADGTTSDIDYVVDNRKPEPIDYVTITEAVDLILEELMLQFGKIFE
ncbi:MAG: metallophosphoesterase family protein [Bacilli bacterium]